MVECSTAKESHGRVLYSPVELSRAMVECSREK